MSNLQLLLVAMGVFSFIVLGYLAMSGTSSTKEATRRLQNVRYRHAENADVLVEAQLRKAVAARKRQTHQIPGSTSRAAALTMRLHQTGKNWTLSQYLYISGGLALAITMLLLITTRAPLLALGIGALIGAGIPHMVVSFLIKRRSRMFTAKFPDAIELLVRGLRSGLPVTETITIVASEVPGPVGEEFKLITDRIRIGKTMEEALQDSADRLNIAEFSFFCITLAIQRETGGNLAETLSNLAGVLRKRSQMKLKIKAMSSEAKASAYIIGVLPFMVAGGIYAINPQYMGAFFSDARLIAIILGGFTWMGIGAFIMSKMVNFEI